MIKGDSKILYLKKSTSQAYEPVGCLNSNSLSEESETINTTTRDNKGWETIKPIRQRYTMSFSGLVNKEYKIGQWSYNELADYKRREQLVQWKLEDAIETIIGRGYIDQLSDSSEIDAFVEFTASLIGYGDTSQEGMPIYNDLYALLDAQSSLTISLDILGRIYKDLSALLGAESELKATLDTFTEYKELSALLDSASEFKAELDTFINYNDLSALLDAESEFKITLDTFIEYKELSALLDAQSDFVATLDTFINYKELSALLDAESEFNVTLDKFINYKDISALLDAQAEFKAELDTFINYKDISALLDAQSNLNLELDKFVNYKDISALLDAQSELNTSLDTFFNYKNISALLNAQSEFDANLDKIVPVVWTSFAVDNRGQQNSNTSCLAGLINDTWHTTSDNTSVGSKIYYTQDLNNPVVGQNKWYYLNDGNLATAIKIGNDGVVDDFVACGI